MVTVFFDCESLGNYKAQLALRGVLSALSKRRYEHILLHDLSLVEPAEQEGQPIIVFSHSESRSICILRDLTEKRYRPVFIVNRVGGFEHAVSCVSIDYRSACYRLTCRVLEGEGKPVAFLGFNSDSIPDKQRLEGFEAAVKQYGAESRIFSNFGNVCSCLEEYWENRYIYKNVVCVNDIHAVALVNRLRENGEDCGEYRVCGFGNTMLSRYCVPRITTVEPNYELAGRCAVEVYAVLEKNRHVRAVTFVVDSEIYEGESFPCEGGDTAFLGVSDFAPTYRDFYNDSLVMELDGLDRMLSLCDETDLGILRGLLAGETYEEICGRHFIAVNTLKYRIKKLMAAAQVSDRAELTERIRKHKLSI